MSSRRSAEHAVGSTTVAESLRSVVGRLAHCDLPLAVRAWDGSCAGPSDAVVTVVVHSPEALRHLLWAPGELGLARAHVQGYLEIEGDVFSLLSLRDRLGAPDEDVTIRAGLRDWAGIAREAWRLGALGLRPPIPWEEARVAGRFGSVRRTTEAVRHHYDVGNDFYRLLLGPNLTYSCGYWTRDGASLDEAQDAKHELVCRKLGLRSGQRLLDIGCGWGSMAIHAARHHDVEVVGLTLSAEQAELARRRVTEAGLDGQVVIRVQDYRETEDGPFDAVSSIGMFEHVPSTQVDRYLATVRRLLRPGGRFLNHAIARPDPEGTPTIDRRSFMGRYVFPDATLHEVGGVISGMHGHGLEVRDVQSLREHYDRTLRTWVENLESSWDVAQRLVGPGRARIWRLYLAGTALGFAQYRTTVYQVLSVNTPPSGRSAMPTTRASLDVSDPVPVIDLRPAGTAVPPAGPPRGHVDGPDAPRTRVAAPDAS